MSSSTPHLHAAQRRICCVVPLKAPSTRLPTWELVRGSSLGGKKSGGNRCPTAWFSVEFMCLFSGIACARTHAVHCEPEGKAVPGGSVPKCAGAADVRREGGDLGGGDPARVGIGA